MTAFQNPQSFLVEARAKLGFGIRKMAEILGTSPATLSRIERGFDFDISTARAVSQKAGVCLCCGNADRLERMSEWEAIRAIEMAFFEGDSGSKTIFHHSV
jgi:transcriptional regulator with XRE-family HTH domain